MVLRRYIPILIVGFFGSFTLFGWFINNETVEAFINDDATQWYDIIASFAIFLGALNLLKLLFLKVLKRQSGWQYSVVAIVSFFAVFIIGFFMRGAFIVDIPATDVQETYFTQKSAEQAVVQLKDSGIINDIEDATIIPMTNTNIYIIIQLEISPPAGTLPIIIIIPASKSSVASKFLALKARYDAEAT